MYNKNAKKFKNYRKRVLIFLSLRCIIIKLFKPV